MKVSVIIPVFNAEKYLGACLESILNQTCADFEVIIVDDCSTDNSAAIVESYLEKFGGPADEYRQRLYPAQRGLEIFTRRIRFLYG